MSDFRALRIGRISSVDKRGGTARVTYEDHGSSTTSELPFLSWIYRMPQIGQFVLVGHLANGSGSSSAVILGPIMTEEDYRDEFEAEESYLDLAEDPGEAFIKYHNGITTIRSRTVVFEDEEGDTVTTIKSLCDRIAALEAILNGSEEGQSLQIVQNVPQWDYDNTAKSSMIGLGLIDVMVVE